MAKKVQRQSTRLKTGGKRSGVYAGVKVEQRQMARRKLILEAGIRIIGTRGYDAATLRAVSKEAKLTERYFYESFKNRESLFKAAYHQISRELMTTIQLAAMSSNKDLKDVAHTVLTAVFDYIQRHPDRGRLLMIEPLGISSTVNQAFQQNIGGFIEFVVNLCTPYLPANAPPMPVLKVMARGGVGAVIYLCQDWIATNFEQPAAELVAGSEKLFIGLMQQIGIRLPDGL